MESSVSNTVLIPQFWFPGWSATQRDSSRLIAVENDVRSGLVRLAVPPGRYSMDLRLCAQGAERIGQISSLMTLGIMAVIFIRQRKTKMAFEKAERL